MPIKEAGHDGVKRCECYHKSLVSRLIEASRIPPHYATATFDNFLDDTDVVNKSVFLAKGIALKWVEDYPNNHGQGLLFMGRPGRGKTHLAVAMIRALIEQKHVPCLFSDFPDLLRQIQHSYNPLTQGSERLILEPILDADVLILDDLGSMKWSEWVKDMVAHVINDRYKRGHSTILTTNYLDQEIDPANTSTKKLNANDSGIVDPAGRIDGFKLKQLKELGLVSYQAEDLQTLEDRIGARLRSRLYQMCRTVRVQGEDFRRQIGRQKRR
jgi:DNA replication protein DnaC